MAGHVETVVIGAGQSGLAVSYCLTQRNRTHVVLEKHRIGEAWRSGKWESFTLVTPNFTLNLPGFPYQGDDPDGFLTRAEVVRYLEDYVSQFAPPVQTGITVTAVRPIADGFTVETDMGEYTASNVVVATGAFQKPRLPMFAVRIDPDILQLHSSQYRNPDLLPPGAVLIVGSGQSGCQIAYELRQAGRKVYLSTGKAGRAPRIYRGREIFHWLTEMGFFDRTTAQLQSEAERFAPNPQLTGRDGGKSLNLHEFARDGVTLLGRLVDGSQTSLTFAPDLATNLTAMDRMETEITKAIDGYIERAGIQAPPPQLPHLRDGYDTEILTQLDTAEAGITAIVWACGYAFDYGWIHAPVLDERGYPIHHRGVTRVPGLYFVGLQWLHKTQSSLFLGVAEDAEFISEHIAGRGM
ncbi:MAG: NAD(P)-binding domain-containing protein [Chloroflexi bacterium]|nr:NAD(P)-binding domain-containing protein [Chloroflexota bacterium]